MNSRGESWHSVSIGTLWNSGFFMEKNCFLVCYLSFLAGSPQIPISLLLAVRLSPELSSGASLGGSESRSIFGNDLWESLHVGLLPKLTGLELKGSSRRKEEKEEGLHSSG